jgi:DNA replication protein DnaC
MAQRAMQPLDPDAWSVPISAILSTRAPAASMLIADDLNTRLKVFVSYSREEQQTAEDLIAGLRDRGFEPRYDRQDIEGGEAWKARISELIGECDAAVFAMSPSWVASKTSAWELEEAEKGGLLLLPVVVNPLGSTSVASQLEDRNYIFYYRDERHPESGPNRALIKLADRLRKDPEWLRAHSKLQQRAHDWKTRGATDDLLLRGLEIVDAKALLERRPPDQPIATVLTRDYIAASERLEATRRSTDRNVEHVLAAVAPIKKPLDLRIYAKQIRENREKLKLTNVAPPQQGGQHDDVNVKDVFVAQLVTVSEKAKKKASEVPKDPADASASDKAKPRTNAGGSEEPKEAAGSTSPGDGDANVGGGSVKEVTRPVHEWLASSGANKMVLLGDPGHGKSTLASDLVLNLLRAQKLLDDVAVEKLPDWTKSLAGHTPFVIELRDYVGKPVSTFVDYFDHLGQNNNFGLEKTALESLLKNQPTLIILDGLDEVKDPARHKDVIQHIKGFANAYDKARVLVTCRKAEYSTETRDELSKAQFQHATLQPFSDKQIDDFLDMWFRRHYPDNTTKAQDGIARVNRQFASPNVKQLARRPLLLTLLVILADSDATYRKRTDFFEQAVKLLIQRWTQGRDPVDRRLSEEFPNDKFKLRLLRRIAWSMHISEGATSNVINEDDLKAVIRDYLEVDRDVKEKGESLKLAERFITTLPQQSFLLHQKGSDSYGFEHDTFFEYLVADSIRDRLYTKHAKVDPLTIEQVEQDFAEHGLDAGWQERLALVCGVVEAAEAARFIEALGYNDDALDDQDERLRVALMFLTDIDPGELIGPFKRLADDLLRRAMKAIDPDNLGSEFDEPLGRSLLVTTQWIGKGWPNADWLDQEIASKLTALAEENSLADDEDGLQIARYGWRLGKIHCAIVQDPAATTFNSLTYHADPKVRAAAIGALFAYNQTMPSTIERSIELAQSDIDPIVRQAALHTFPDPEDKLPIGKRDIIFDLFMTAAARDVDKRPREAAIWELANCFPKRVEGFEFLTEIAINDPDESFRLLAADRINATYFDVVERAELRSFLLEFAEKDLSPGNRASALRLVSQRYFDDAEVSTFLRQRVSEDPSPDPRSAALDELASRNVDSFDVLAFLKSTAIDGVDGRTRGTAINLVVRKSFETADIGGILRHWVATERDPRARANAIQLLQSLLRERPHDKSARESLLAFANDLATNDPEPAPRTFALAFIAHYTLDRTEQRLLTRDVDGLAPWFDPANSIGLDTVKRAAARMRTTEDDIRALYQGINARLKFLRLDWATTGPGPSALAGAAGSTSTVREAVAAVVPVPLTAPTLAPIPAAAVVAQPVLPELSLAGEDAPTMTQQMEPAQIQSVSRLVLQTQHSDNGQAGFRASPPQTSGRLGWHLLAVAVVLGIAASGVWYLGLLL